MNRKPVWKNFFRFWQICRQEMSQISAEVKRKRKYYRSVVLLWNWMKKTFSIQISCFQICQSGKVFPFSSIINLLTCNISFFLDMSYIFTGWIWRDLLPRHWLLHLKLSLRTKTQLTFFFYNCLPDAPSIGTGFQSTYSCTSMRKSTDVSRTLTKNRQEF